jgi:hypothetical protein
MLPAPLRHKEEEWLSEDDEDSHDKDKNYYTWQGTVLDAPDHAIL